MATVFASHSAPILEQKVGACCSKASRAKLLDSSTFEAAVEVSVNVKGLCLSAVCPGTLWDTACSAGCRAVFDMIVCHIPQDSAPLVAWICGCDS